MARRCAVSGCCELQPHPPEYDNNLQQVVGLTVLGLGPGLGSILGLRV